MQSTFLAINLHFFSCSQLLSTSSCGVIPPYVIGRPPTGLTYLFKIQVVNFSDFFSVFIEMSCTKSSGYWKDFMINFISKTDPHDKCTLKLQTWLSPNIVLSNNCNEGLAYWIVFSTVCNIYQERKKVMSKSISDTFD